MDALLHVSLRTLYSLYAEGSVSDLGGFLLASEDMVCKQHDVVKDSMVSFPMQGPDVPGRRQILHLRNFGL